MKTYKLTAIVSVATLFLAPATFATPKAPDRVTSDQAYWERVQASFDNMLHHEPYAGPTQTTIDRSKDHEVERMLFKQRDAAAKQEAPHAPDVR